MKQEIYGIRLRLLRHKWEYSATDLEYHLYWLLMFQSRWPFIKFRSQKSDGSIFPIITKQRNSFDMIIEYYQNSGQCGFEICCISSFIKSKIYLLKR